MKLATLNNGKRDGALVVVSRDLSRAVRVPQLAATLQAALDEWAELAPKLTAVYQQLNDGACADAFRSTRRPVSPRCRAPTSGLTAAPMSTTWSWCARPAAPKCQKASGTILIYQGLGQLPAAPWHHPDGVGGVGHRFRVGDRRHHRRRADGHQSAGVPATSSC